MIIWSRWGIVVLLFVGLGVLLGFGLASLLGFAEASGASNGVFVGVGFMLSGIALWAFNAFVVGRYIDKPHAAFFYEKLAEPQALPDGRMTTTRAVPVLHPETGEQVWSRPVSTFFFIPIRFWVFILPALGLVIFVINLVVLLGGGD